MKYKLQLPEKSYIHTETTKLFLFIYDISRNASFGLFHIIRV